MGLCPVSVVSEKFGIHMNDFMDYYADDTLYHRTFESEAELFGHPSGRTHV